MILSVGPDLFSAIANLILIFLKSSTAKLKSCRPKGVGSVTKIQKSLPLTEVTTGQDVPGGQSLIVKPSLSIYFLTCTNQRSAPLVRKYQSFHE